MSKPTIIEFIIKKISNKFHGREWYFSVIFAGMALKLEKVQSMSILAIR